VSAPPGELTTGFRTQPIPSRRRDYTGWIRQMARLAYVREVPGQVPQIEQSLAQVTNVPAKVQVDIATEYVRPWPFLGVFGYRERMPYTGQGQPVQQPRPQYPFALQAPRWSTLPMILGVGRG